MYMYMYMYILSCTYIIVLYYIKVCCMLLHLCTSVQLLGYLYTLHTLMHCVNAKASWIHVYMYSTDHAKLIREFFYTRE